MFLQLEIKDKRQEITAHKTRRTQSVELLSKSATIRVLGFPRASRGAFRHVEKFTTSLGVFTRAMESSIEATPNLVQMKEISAIVLTAPTAMWRLF